MTVTQLFTYISLAVLVQVAIGAAIAFARHLRSYGQMKQRLAGYDPEPDARPAPSLAAAADKTDNPGRWEGLRDFKVVSKVFEDESRQVCSFYLRPVDGGPLPLFKPGQYLTFQLDVADPESAGTKTITRCYSLSDAPGQETYRVSIKREAAPQEPPGLPPGLSSTHFHDHVNEGDVLRVKAPGGHYFLQDGNEPVVLIGGGIGLTPVLSMLNATLNAGSQREIWLFYGVRNGAEHVMKAHLEALAEAHENFHLHVCYSRPRAEDRLGVDYQHAGRVSVDLLRMTLNFKLYEFYICGPGALMESIVPALDDWGVPDPHIHYEAFGPATVTRRKRNVAPPAAAAAETGEGLAVTFARSGQTLTWDGTADSLLDLGEQNGLRLESGCRAGGCGACQATLVSGEVDYKQDPDYDPEPGTCLMCIARPKGDVTVEA